VSDIGRERPRSESAKLNPYEPPRVHRRDGPPASLSTVLITQLISWWFLPCLFATVFAFPVLVLGLADPNLNPLDFKSFLLQGLVNLIVGAIGGLLAVVYARYRLRPRS
jgi:hypothetical protein